MLHLVCAMPPLRSNFLQAGRFDEMGCIYVSFSSELYTVLFPSPKGRNITKFQCEAV